MAAKFLNKIIPRTRPYVVVGVAGVVVLVYMVFYFPNQTKLKRLRQENLGLLLRMHKLEKEIRDYEGKLHRVKKDPYILEKVAREDLGVAKEGEIVVDIKE